jgi:hypothetical protein
MALMSGEATGLNEYELRLFSETWVEKTLRLLIKLEQAYETDTTILAMAGKKAQLFQKFGISVIDDELLNESLTSRVNVGIGATNPAMKLKNFATGAEIISKIFGPTAAMGANFEEISKEIFGLLGYKDGARFFQPGFDPRVAMLQQQMQKMHQASKQPPPADPTRVQTATIQAQGRLAEQNLKNQNDQAVAQIDKSGDQQGEQAENWRALLDYQKDMVALEHQMRTAAMGGGVHPALRGVMG